MQLPGRPSDDVAEVLATGGGDITTLFVSMATRHPDGTDAEYLRWHTLDHRPEQHRLSDVRASLRLVSTPACRSARAASTGRYDAIDHVMTYFFSDLGGMKGFLELSRALGDAGRNCRCYLPSSAGSMRSVKRQPLRGSRSVPTCCRGGRPEGCTSCWRPTRRRRRSWPTSMASRVSGLPRRGWSTPDWRARLRAR